MLVPGPVLGFGLIGLVTLVLVNNTGLKSLKY